MKLNLICNNHHRYALFKMIIKLDKIHIQYIVYAPTATKIGNVISQVKTMKIDNVRIFKAMEK